MCRSSAEGGRRCPGGHVTSREAQNARQQLCRARRALASAEASGDSTRIAQAQERVLEAQDTIQAVRILAGTDQPDVPNAAGLRRAEREAVSVYAGGEFLSINKYVENDYQVPAYAADDREYVRHMRATTAALKRAVNRSKLAERTQSTRAIPAHTAEQAYGPIGSGLGQTITENRFSSTTTNATPDPTFGDVTVNYDLAPGTRALDINASGVPCKEDEKELLIGPHQDFVKVSDELVAGKRVIGLQSVALNNARPRSTKNATSPSAA